MDTDNFRVLNTGVTLISKALQNFTRQCFHYEKLGLVVKNIF